MGILADCVELLVSSRNRGVRFDRTLMLGRQNIFVGKNEFAKILEQLGRETDAQLLSSLAKSGDYADRFFAALGAKSVDSMDASDFEGASVVHDLNKPVPPDLREQYDVVFDGGTIEHVYDFPSAIRNCMSMVKVGGHLILYTPSNNFMGHGFYQFSPELFFRLLSKENGFAMGRTIACEYGPRRRWYQVIDPADARARGQVINRYPTALYVEARKTGMTPEVLQPPLQSDYEMRWEDHESSAETEAAVKDIHAWINPNLRQRVLEAAPTLIRALERLHGARFNRVFSLRNARNFRWLRRPSQD